MLAVVLDVVYQIIAEHFVYPGEAITVAIVLALVPYLVSYHSQGKLPRRYLIPSTPRAWGRES